MPLYSSQYPVRKATHIKLNNVLNDSDLKSMIKHDRTVHDPNLHWLL